MPFDKHYDAALDEVIKALAKAGQSSGMIAAKLGKTRSSIAAYCTRNKIKLTGAFTLQSPDGVKHRKPKQRAPALPDDAVVFAQCLWPDGCQDLRQTWKKPYCLEHNRRAFVMPKMLSEFK